MISWKTRLHNYKNVEVVSLGNRLGWWRRVEYAFSCLYDTTTRHCHCHHCHLHTTITLLLILHSSSEFVDVGTFPIHSLSQLFEVLY